MKRLKLLMAALMLTTGISSLSAKNYSVKKESGSIGQHIQNMIQVPKSLMTQGFNESVKVHFIVDKAGNVEEVLCVCADPLLKNSVESQFTKLNFSQFKAHTLYTVNINFRVL